ncbi:hypothetical protein AK812_SmicGene41908 [Symbiodinium microadriaticum]|uniref:Uncharacterized protein n=1 Tax=Symbiodinium microadriaticum TaxID=2951 RepID=A0A1Q9C4X3_SYMMI|nr:hypothetical protein AK812_SmicGene41908 [Symbiodinium microadriaticum]CAE7537919.1 unnamed protein product [Symbiodinium microadriaticum]
MDFFKLSSEAREALGLRASSVQAGGREEKRIACRATTSACSDCKENDELLTSAIVEKMEMAHLAEHDFEVESPSSTNPGALFRRLQVPAEFDGAQTKVLQAVSGNYSPSSAREKHDQQRCLKVCVQSFTRALLQGINVCVLLDDNRTRLAEARLDSDITHLVLHVPHAQHPVALKYIDGICPPTPTWPTPSFGEDGCLQSRATLTMRGGQFLTFVFDSPRVREYFEMCLKVLIIAKGGERTPEDTSSGEILGASLDKDSKVEISSC